MMRRWIGAAVIAAWMFAPEPAAAEVSFAREVAPVLLKRCGGCHGERANLGGYRASTFRLLLKAGDSGQPPVMPGKPDASSLYRLLVTKSAERRMPKGGDSLPAAEIERVRKWIAEGAKFDGPDPTAPLKSLQGPRRHPAAPAVYRAPVPVMALALAPGGEELYVGGYHEVTVWRASDGRLLRRLPGLPQRIQALVFSPDGKALIVAGGTPGEYGELAVVDLASGRREVLDTFDDLVLTAALSPDGRLLAAGGADSGVRVYNRDSHRRLWSSRVHADWVTAVAFSGDGRFLASSSKDHTVKVYEVRDGSLFTTYTGHNRQLGEFRGQHPVYGAQFAGGLAYSAGGGRWIQVWEPEKAREENGTAADMEQRFSKQGHARYLEHGFTQEVHALRLQGGQLFAASADGLLKQFDPGSLKEVRAYRGHADWIFALDYDPASHRLASGDFSGEVRIWDTCSGACVATFRPQPGRAPVAAAR